MINPIINEEWCVEGFVVEAGGKETLPRRSRRWGDIIEIDLQERVWEVLDSIIRFRIGTGFRT